MEGNGTYIFDNGNRYEGEFLDGMFHGKGVIYFKGAGKFEATWDHGKVVTGNYTFSDDLEYKPEDWDYCIDNDRRFYTERLNGIQPAGSSQLRMDPLRL